MFLVHASGDTTATDAAYMGWLSYSALLDVAGVTDDASPGVRQADLDTLFKAANFEAKNKEVFFVCSFVELSLWRAEWSAIIPSYAKAIVLLPP